MSKRILILDDNKAILEVVTEALAYEGYEVLPVSFGHQLLDSVKSFLPNLILLDYKLSDATGSDLCRQLKTSALYRHIPVIIFSAYVNRGEVLGAECESYLYKPFDLAELSAAVRSLLPASQEAAYGN
ncbi:MAG: response regulator [Mucilaginibacter sp.]